MSATSEPDLEPGLSRRSMLGRSGAAGVVLAGSVGGLFGTSEAEARRHGRKPPKKHGHKPPKHGNGHGGGEQHPDEPGYGPLIADPKGLLALPAGFSYTVVAQAGVTKLDSGEPTPSDADGTAAFVRRGGNGSVLISNHEISGEEPYKVPHVKGLVYDETCSGGTTNVVVDAAGNRVREYVSLAGTSTNCAGGRTPWETWLTCEETEEIKGKPHGYVFEVDPYDQEANQNPAPIKCLGRYAHESLVVDPNRGTIYLTEDAGNPNGLLYKWTPPRQALPLTNGSLRQQSDTAGTLEAMLCFDRYGRFVPDLSPASTPGLTYALQWVNVPDRDAKTVSTRKQFGTGQITRSRKLEGMWWGDGGAYFVCSFARTSDGSAAQHDGQVWFLDPDDQTITLKLYFGYTPGDQDNDPDGPDNITVSAYGGVIMAEDGEGVQHLVGSTDEGETFFFARNEKTDENSEFTGPTFSRDNKILFANVQTPGATFAIQGPFEKRKHR